MCQNLDHTYMQNSFSRIFFLDWASEDRVAVAVYMEGIVTFINLRSNQLVKGVKSLPDFLPLSIKNKIFETFTDDS